VCVYKPPTVRRVCGIIVDPDGRPIPGVKVTVSKDGATVWWIYGSHLFSRGTAFLCAEPSRPA
jgi:hypothetical protein